MSLRTLLIWCIIAGLLGGAAVVLRNQHAKTVRSQEILWGGLQFDPASVVTFRVESETGGVEIVRDADSVDEWDGRWELGNGSQGWGVTSTRVRGALRTLSTTQIRLSDEVLVEDGTRVELRSRSGSVVELLIGNDRSGGRSPVRVQQRDESGAIERVLNGWMEAGTARALTPENTLGWRDTRLMSVAMSSITGVRVRAGQYETRIELRDARWEITEPIRIHAERERVEELLRTVLALRAEGFVDGAVDPETSGLGSPIAVIRVDTRDGTYRLSVGQVADIGSDRLYASFARDGSETLIRIPLSSLSKLTAVPDAYVANHASELAQTRIQGLRVLGRDGGVRFESVRDSGEWVSGGERVDSITRMAIDRLLRLLVQTPSDAVRLLDPGAEMPRAISGVVFVDAQGDPIGTYDIALEQGDQGMRLLVSRSLNGGKRVVWAYNGEDAQATGTWLTLTSGRASESN